MSDIVNHTQGMSEEDMAKVRSLFARGADAIVSASQLARDVEELRKSMDELKQSYEEVVTNNKFLLRQIHDLDTQLAEVKNDRDEARKELSAFNQRLAQRDDEIKELQTAHNEQADTIARLRKESDDYQFRAMDAEDKLDTIKGKLSEATAWFEDVNTFLNPPKEPEPEQNVVEFKQEEPSVPPTSAPTEAMPWQYGIGNS